MWSNAAREPCIMTLLVPVLQQYYYNDAIMSTMASQITNLMIVYSTVYSGEDQRKHLRSASMAFVRWIHWWPVNSPRKGPVMRKMFPFDDVIMLDETLAISLPVHSGARQSTGAVAMARPHINLRNVFGSWQTQIRFHWNTLIRTTDKSGLTRYPAVCVRSERIYKQTHQPRVTDKHNPIAICLSKHEL